LRDLVAAALLQANELEDLLNPVFGSGSPTRRQGPEIGSAGEVWVERGRLDQRPNLEQATTIAPTERPAKQLDRAAVRVDQAGEEAHRRGLPGAVRAKETVNDA
jgi:hypothetical protein